MTKQQTVPVSERAAILRINRRLRADDQVLKTTRGARARLDLGDFYVLDFRNNLALQTNVDLESFGRELGALAEYEHVVEA